VGEVSAGFRNFAKRDASTIWTPVSNPPSEGERVAVTHEDDVFSTETTGKLSDGKWETACAFMVAGGHALAFAPTHWRSLAEGAK
jgi:hypothetical protein